MLDFPATAKNSEPIAQVLEGRFKKAARLSCLEVASGSGQHCLYLARRFPNWRFQPSDLESLHQVSIAAYRDDAGLENIEPPLTFDVSLSPWPVTESYDLIIAINMIHISAWSCTVGLFTEGAKHVAPGGHLFLYGAFRQDGRHTAPSNLAFDEGLRRQNPAWGVRCLDEVSELAASQGWSQDGVVAMPANNLSVVFVRDSKSSHFQLSGVASAAERGVSKRS